MMVIINNVACNTFKMMIFSLCCFASDMSDERRFFFFFPSNFFHFCHLSFCRVCLFFFFQTSNPSEKKTRKREKFLFCLSSLFSLKSLSLSPSLSPLSLSFFLTRERERKKCVCPFLFFLREYREREEKKLRFD